MTYTFDLDMTPGGVPQMIRLSRYDKNTPTLKFNLWDGSTAYTIEAGSTVFINGTKPDNTSFEYYCEYSGSEVTVNVTEQMTAVAGRTTCEIVVYTNGERKGSANFYLDVEPSALSDDTVISETDIPIIQRIPEIVAEVEAAKYLAQQWAVGSGSGQDIPSDTNNAYYWAMQAASYAGGGLKPEIVQSLPTTDISTSTLYFVPSQSPTSSNIYDEYINTDGTSQGWELIGTTAIDMSDYYTSTQVDTLLADKQDKTDNNLETTSKQIVGAINEVNGKIAANNIVINRWLRPDFTNKKGLIIKAGAKFKLQNGNLKVYAEDTAVNLSEETLIAGKDYFVFCDNDGTISVSQSATPGATQVKIGRFHTLCANVGTINMIAPTNQTASGGDYLVKPYSEEEDPDFYAFYNKTVSTISTGTYYNVATMQHPLSGYEAGDILPESIFCLDFHPETMFEDAMVYDKATDKAIDVYLQSGTGLATRSAYGAVHTVSRQQPNHLSDMLVVGKELLTDTEFTSASMGSNQATNIYGSADASTVGGHSDTAGRRMISAIGCEEMCGYLLQWLKDLVTATSATAWANTDGQGSFGQEYWTPHALLAGGPWGSGAACGSRCRDSDSVRSRVSAYLGGRGSSRVRRGA